MSGYLNTVENSLFFIKRFFELEKRMFILKVPHVDITVDTCGCNQVVFLIYFYFFNQSCRALQHVDWFIVDGFIYINVPLFIS